MRLGILLLFAAVPFVEIALMIKVGQSIGFWSTVALIMTSAALGTYVLYEQGFQVMARAMDAVNRGRTPMGPVVDGVFILLAGTLLILPGFLTDAIGLSLLVPGIRRRFAAWSIRRVLRSAEMRGFVFGAKTGGFEGRSDGARHDGERRSQPGQGSGSGQVIDGEFQHLGDRTVDHGASRPRRDGA